DGQAPLGGGEDEAGVLARPRADVDGVDGVEEGVLPVDHRGPGRLGERLGLGPVGIVDGGDDVVGARAAKALAVVGGDKAGAEEPDADGHVFWTRSPPSTGTIAPVRYDAAGRTRDRVMWATSSGSP